MIQIAILDDHQMFIDGIVQIIQEEAEINLIAIFKSEKECLDYLKDNKINILLNDIQLNNEDGIEICNRIKNGYPYVKILMLTMFNDVSYVKRAFNNNADGYLLKSSGRAELLNAINKVYNGDKFIDPEIKYFKGSIKDSDVIIDELEPKLSRREKEVLTLILEEHTTLEIAEQLFISPKTIESHRSNLLAKFDVRNIAGLVRKTVELKIDLSS